MKPKLLFVLDVPGWSIDNYIHRIGPHLNRFDLAKHYVFANPDDARNGLTDTQFKQLPEADVYYFGSWWWLWEWTRRGGRRLNNAVIDVVDDYSWVQSRVQFEIAESRAALVLTQSLPFVCSRPRAVFHPYPAGVDWFNEPLRCELDSRDRPLKVGMIASAFAHKGGDHKGVLIAKAACKAVEGVELIVAGTTVKYSFDKLKEFYQGIDAFMCLSKSEGFSSSTVNAAALGVPIISTPVSPTEPFIGEDGVFIVPDRRCGDTEVLSAVTFWLRTMKNERLTIFNRLCHTRRIAEQWRADLVAKQIETVLSGLL